MRREKIIIVAISALLLLGLSSCLLEIIPDSYEHIIEIDKDVIGFAPADGNNFYSSWAFEFQIPLDCQKNIITSIDCYMNLGWYSSNTKHSKVGLSKVLTIDYNQWEFYNTWRMSGSGSCWVNMLKISEDFRISPGETWYFICKSEYVVDDYRIYNNLQGDGLNFYFIRDWRGSPLELQDFKMGGIRIQGAVDEPFYVDFEWSPVYPEPGEQIQFTDTSHPELISEWEWVFEPGQYSYSQNPVYTFNGIGEYTVTLTAISVHGTPIEINKQIIVNYGIPESVTCYKCINDNLASAQYDDTCPDGWYLEEDIPDGYCDGQLPEPEELDMFWVYVAIAIIAGGLVIVFIRKR